jgi:hypothetical protein
MADIEPRGEALFLSVRGDLDSSDWLRSPLVNGLIRCKTPPPQPTGRWAMAMAVRKEALCRKTQLKRNPAGINRSARIFGAADIQRRAHSLNETMAGRN